MAVSVLRLANDANNQDLNSRNERRHTVDDGAAMLSRREDATTGRQVPTCRLSWHLTGGVAISSDQAPQVTSAAAIAAPHFRATLGSN
jgi:hypothetical protein